MISVRGLVKRYGLIPVLRGLDFEVREGEFVCLVGPNGAGKTTFLRILTSLNSPTAGRVEVAGLPIPAAAARARRLLGVLGHQPLLYRDLTAEQNLHFYARMYGLNDGRRRTEVLLEQVGLLPVRNQPVRAFSRGMQQRLAIARGLLHGPPLLLLDEPYTGLDQDAAATLDELLSEVLVEGRTVVMTSHNLARAHRLAQRVDVLSRGVIAASIDTAKTGLPELEEIYRQVTLG